MRPFTATVFGTLTLALVVFAASSGVVEARKVNERTAIADRTIFDCVNELDRVDGGWCELSGAAVADVFPTPLDDKVRMVTGPRSVIDAWTGAAYDPDTMTLYFHGGGHTDYGGNEVYSFGLRDGTWRRLTDPAPLARQDPKTQCPKPEDGPSASHTYDGFIYSRATSTIWMFPVGYACLSSMFYADGDFWEFNPSTSEVRNGIGPLRWRYRGKVPEYLRSGYFRTAEYPDGRLFVGTRGQDGVLDPRTMEWKRIGAHPDYGDGSSIFDPVRNAIWSVHRQAILRSSKSEIAKKIAAVAPGLGGGAGMALDPSGKLIFWNGGPLIYSFDPGTLTWRLFEAHERKPPVHHGKVYSKWIFLPSLRVYVGYADSRHGVWVYRHPAGREGVAVQTQSIQAMIDAAEPGATVTVPPGIYPAGARISRPITLKLKGVRILGPTASKAVLLIKDVRGPVNIEDFRSTEPVRCGNCAGIKIEGADFDVTIRRAFISNAEMGILTDNRGGRLTIEDTLIEDIGHSEGREPMHLIYVGQIDRLVVRRTRLQRSFHYGHILKSRARITEVYDSYLLGRDSLNSREADLPCGGRILFDRVVVQKGPNSDNNDSIAIGTEPKHCQMHPDTSFTLRNSWIVFDRSVSKLITAPFPVAFSASGNRFVGEFKWGDVPSASGGNRFFRSRRAAGLGAGELPVFESRATPIPR